MAGTREAELRKMREARAASAEPAPPSAAPKPVAGVLVGKPRAVRGTGESYRKSRYRDVDRRRAYMREFMRRRKLNPR